MTVARAFYRIDDFAHGLPRVGHLFAATIDLGHRVADQADALVGLYREMGAVEQRCQAEGEFGVLQCDQQGKT